MYTDDVLSSRRFSAEGPVKTDLLRSTMFNVVVVCLETGQEIPPHPEPYAVFFLVLEGEGLFTTGKDSFRLRSGSGIFIERDGVRGIRCLDRMSVLGVQEGH
jgi:quercetin dioxygenase-like cupin family protein